MLSLPARRKGYMIWDGGNGRNSGEVQRGLGIWVSPLGAKSYRSMFYFPGSSKSHTRWIGEVGVTKLEEAREQCRQDRRNASKGIDPRAGDPTNSGSYPATVSAYVDKVQIGDKHNVRAEECRRVLLTNAKAWHARNIASITNTEIRNSPRTLRDGDDKLGLKPRPYLANLVYARMKPMFDWCTERRYQQAGNITNVRAQAAV